MEIFEFEFYTPHGHMRINIEGMFPSGAARIKKMVKIMKQDPRNDVTKLLEDLKKILSDFIDDIKETREIHVSQMFKWCHKKNALEKYLNEMRFPTGEPIESRKDLAEMKKRVKQAKDQELNYRRDIERDDRAIKRLKENIELINQLEE